MAERAGGMPRGPQPAAGWRSTRAGAGFRRARRAGRWSPGAPRGAGPPRGPLAAPVWNAADPRPSARVPRGSRNFASDGIQSVLTRPDQRSGPESLRHPGRPWRRWIFPGSIPKPRVAGSTPVPRSGQGLGGAHHFKGRRRGVRSLRRALICDARGRTR